MKPYKDIVLDMRQTERRHDLLEQMADLAQQYEKLESALNDGTLEATEHRGRGRPKGSKNKTTKVKVKAKVKTTVATKAKTVVKHRRAKNETSLRELVLKILGNHKDGMSLGDILTAVVKAGHKTTGDIGQMVYQTMYKLKKEKDSGVVVGKNEKGDDEFKIAA